MTDYEDYENNLAFPPQGDWADTQPKNNTDRTDGMIELLNKYEQLKKENRKLEWRLDKARTGLGYVGNGWLKTAEEMRARAKLALDETYDESRWSD